MSVDSYIQFTSKTSGRDKIFRLLQYTSKLVSHVLTNGKPDDNILKRFMQFEAVLSTSRKTFRLGKTIDSIDGVRKISSIQDPVLKTLIISSKLSYAVFFVYDMLTWAIKAGVISGNTKMLSLHCDRCWFSALSFLILRDIYEITKLKNADFKEVAKDNPQIVVDLAKNIADIIQALNSLNKVNLSRGTIGICGIISSVLGIVQMVYPQYKLLPA